jgi:hypothetical protein
MSNTVVVYKDRTNIMTVSLGIDVSGDVLTSEIRTESGLLIATWDVAFDGDGTDGELVLTLDDSAVSSITYFTGLMDIKRVSGGEPFPGFDKPVEVEFRETITV